MTAASYGDAEVAQVLIKAGAQAGSLSVAAADRLLSAAGSLPRLH